MEQVSLSTEPVFDEGDYYELEGDFTEHDNGTGETHRKKDPREPTVGVEFDSFDEAYDFYNIYGKEQGFGIRVSNSWFRSRRNERYGAKLCCSSAGFKYKGYLCRHTLNVLNYNGVEGYILPRWSKDFKCRYLLHHGSSNIDMYHWYNHLYKLALPVAEEGAQSEEHYKTTLQALEELLNKLHLVEDNLV